MSSVQVRGFSITVGDSVFDKMRKKRRQKEELNRERLGVLLLRECKGSRIICSGSVVKVKSEVFAKCEFCLLTSDVFPPGDIQVNDYYMEFWTSDLKSISKLELSEAAECRQSSQLESYRSSSGLVLIPTKRKNSSVCDRRRSFHTDYHNKDEETNGDDIQCYIVGRYNIDGKDSLSVESFTLITNSDQLGQLRYELRDSDGKDFKTYDDIKRRFAYLCPRGGVLLKGRGEQATCVGVLDFSRDGLVSPVFLTRASLTG